LEPRCSSRRTKRAPGIFGKKESRRSGSRLGEGGAHGAGCGRTNLFWRSARPNLRDPGNFIDLDNDAARYAGAGRNRSGYFRPWPIDSADFRNVFPGDKRVPLAFDQQFLTDVKRTTRPDVDSDRAGNFRRTAAEKLAVRRRTRSRSMDLV
jgi:hypothetical protein